VKFDVKRGGIFKFLLRENRDVFYALLFESDPNHTNELFTTEAEKDF